MAKLTLQSKFAMNDGRKMPALGFGVYQLRPGETSYRAIMDAFELGYRHVDTAAMYGNESDVGRAVKNSGLKRSDIFVTTKLWNDDHGFDEALEAFDTSLDELGLDYVDLYLIHWPVAKLRLDSWRALRQIREEGRAKSIGVSNYTVRHLKELEAEFGEVPSVNQVEMSPFLSQNELRDFCVKKEIVIEAYSPLTRGARLRDARLVKIAEECGKTPAQILIRWCLEKGVVPLPKSSHRERIAENADVFDFVLHESHIAALDEMNEDLHVSWDPAKQK